MTFPKSISGTQGFWKQKMTIDEAIEIANERNGIPHENDWELAEAAVLLSSRAVYANTLDMEVRSVLAELDHLAEIWGDEGVFRRCRDRLRNALNQSANLTSG